MRGCVSNIWCEISGCMRGYVRIILCLYSSGKEGVSQYGVGKIRCVNKKI